MSYVGIWDRATDGEWRAPIDQYEAISHAIEHDAKWVTFRTQDGADVTLRVTDVVSYVYVNDEAESVIKARVAQQNLGS